MAGPGWGRGLWGHQDGDQLLCEVVHGDAVGCPTGFPGVVMPSNTTPAAWWPLHHLSDQLAEPWQGASPD
jgi:hypothetical protein